MDAAQNPAPATRPYLERFLGLFLFTGRAQRSDLVLLWLIGIVLSLPIPLLHFAGLYVVLPNAVSMIINGVVGYLWATFLVRRLHDQGRSARWALALYGLAGLIILGVAAQPQQQYGTSFRFLLWTFHPVGSVTTTLLSVAYIACIGAMLVISLIPPQDGPNRYGPDPRTG
ncbi:DUF805 domain-containing protein [Sphingomonas sp. AOB5]|uniref:DUF805 domain-containing protein n=1 Tax=Sphingomonas sp. AOB5 TaxID=3034017 RepID=UPI0023F82B0D|nr:DUF805 domain-containing protein [Sphingomonas sp. AOB5]MDF7774987.1 DUF805 domain-containing protein [Sphingomonas sp. AOB5]